MKRIRLNDLVHKILENNQQSYDIVSNSVIDFSGASKYLASRGYRQLLSKKDFDSCEKYHSNVGRKISQLSPSTSLLNYYLKSYFYDLDFQSMDHLKEIFQEYTLNLSEHVIKFKINSLIKQGDFEKVSEIYNYLEISSNSCEK